MIHLPDTISRALLRLAQAGAVLGVLLIIAALAAIGIARVQLARMQQDLAPIISRQLRHVLGRDVRIAGLRLHGLNSVVLSDVSIARGATFTAGTALRVPQVRARVNLLALALRRGKDPVQAINSLALHQPALEVHRDTKGRWDFQDVLDRQQQSNTPLRLTTKVTVEGGTVAYHDARGFGTAPQRIDQTMDDVQATVAPYLGGGVHFALSADDAAHRLGRVELAGQYSNREGAARVQVKTNPVAVTEIARFIPEKLPIVFQQGTASLRLSALFTGLPSPETVRRLPSTALVAEADLAGVGLRVRELTTPLVATSGRLRLVHDKALYPRGSRLELLGVKMQAQDIPITVAGTLSELNLLDRSHLDPRVDVKVTTGSVDGARLVQLFAPNKWPRRMQLAGDITLQTQVTGKLADLHIDGTVRGDHAQVHDVDADGVAIDFALRPAATREQASLQAQVKIQRARVGEAAFSGLTAAVASHTPWDALAKAPVLTGTASARQAQLPWATAEDIHSTLRAERTGITLDELQADLFGGQARGSLAIPFLGELQPANDVLHAAVRYTGMDLRRLAGAIKMTDLSGKADGTLTLAVSPTGKLTLATDVTAKTVGFRDYTASTVRADLRVVGEHGAITAAIPHATLQTEYGRFTIADGAYTRPAGTRADGTILLPLTGEGIALARFGTKDFSLTGDATLRGTLSGDISSPTLTADLAAGNGAVQQLTFQQASGKLFWHGEALRLRELAFSRPGLTMAIPGGADGFDPRAGLDGVTANVQVQGATLDEVLGLFHQRSPWRVDGGVQGELTVTFQHGGITLAGTAAIPQAVIHVPQEQDDYPLNLDRLALDFTLVDRAMTIRDLQADRGSSTIHAQGTANFPENHSPVVELAYQGDHARLQDMPLDLLGIPVALAGDTAARGTVRGPLDGAGDPLEVTVAGSAPRLLVEGLPVGTGTADITFRYRPGDRELLVRRGTVENAAFTATSSGEFHLDQGRMDGVTLALAIRDLAQLRTLADGVEDGQLAMLGPLLGGLPEGLTGHGEATLEISGAFARPQVGAQFALDDIKLGATPLPNLRGKLASELAGNRYRLRIHELVARGGAEGEAQVSGLVTERGELDLRVSARDITAGVLAPWLGALPVDGRAGLTGTITGPWQSPVVVAEVQVAKPVVAGLTLEKAAARVRLTRERLTLADGTIWTVPGATPVTVEGSVPLDGTGVARTAPLALTIHVPQQNLSTLRAFAPALPPIDGTVEGQVQVGGTLAAPRLADGRLTVLGALALPNMEKAYPNRLEDIALRLRLADRAGQTRVTVEQLSATLTRRDNGKTDAGFKPGWIASAGTVEIPAGMLATPERWTWDVYAKVIRLPLSPSLFLVPQMSGYLHLENDGATPVVKGVMLVEDAKIKEPKVTTGSTPHWGPFNFNPRLSLVLQVGQGVKLSKSIFRVPLLPASLPRPALPATTATAAPPLTIDTNQREYAYNADMLNPGVSGEMPGTWGVVTGSLNDPRLYARFEVDKKKLSFPLNLIGSVRHARGHITYSLADGPRIVMGIPDFPTGSTAQTPAPAAPGM